MGRILHYLERRWYGEKAEENIAQDLDASEFATRNLVIEQNLRAVLVRNPNQTMEVLSDQYDLTPGNLAPSPFAIALVVRLKVHSECPVLQSSQQDLTRFHSLNAPLLKALADAQATLGCT